MKTYATSSVQMRSTKRYIYGRSDEADRFILMNNGVTMITRILQTTGDKFVIGDYQIVDGCETCHVLHVFDELPDAVRVPFRLIHTQVEFVIEDIIRATNRQTEVKDDQFFAMRDFAKKLEAYSRRFQSRHVYITNAALISMTRRILKKSASSLIRTLCGQSVPCFSVCPK